jgi:hypothetical protein
MREMVAQLNDRVVHSVQFELSQELKEEKMNILSGLSQMNFLAVLSSWLFQKRSKKYNVGE